MAFLLIKNVARRPTKNKKAKFVLLFGLSMCIGKIYETPCCSMIFTPSYLKEHSVGSQAWWTLRPRAAFYACTWSPPCHCCMHDPVCCAVAPPQVLGTFRHKMQGVWQHELPSGPPVAALRQAHSKHVCCVQINMHDSIFLHLQMLGELTMTKQVNN